MIKGFIKKELSGWSRKEIFSVGVILCVILYNSVCLKDSYIAVVSAVCGLLYTFFAGKGKISCYLFGLTGSGFYGYLSFINGLFGNCLLYVGYYIPMQILGIFKWKQNLKKDTNEIYKTKLSFSQRVVLFCVSVLLSLTVSALLFFLKDSNPLLDGVSVSLSLVAMYLTVRRCIEQWVLWGIVNFICVLMWVKVVLNGQKTYSTVFMWLCYFILAFYFYKKWKKEIEKENS